MYKPLEGNTEVYSVSDKYSKHVYSQMGVGLCQDEDGNQFICTCGSNNLEVMDSDSGEIVYQIELDDPLEVAEKFKSYTGLEVINLGVTNNDFVKKILSLIQNGTLRGDLVQVGDNEFHLVHTAYGVVTSSLVVKVSEDSIEFDMNKESATFSKPRLDWELTADDISPLYELLGYKYEKLINYIKNTYPELEEYPVYGCSVGEYECRGSVSTYTDLCDLMDGIECIDDDMYTKLTSDKVLRGLLSNLKDQLNYDYELDSDDTPGSQITVKYVRGEDRLIEEDVY